MLREVGTSKNRSPLRFQQHSTLKATAPDPVGLGTRRSLLTNANSKSRSRLYPPRPQAGGRWGQSLCPLPSASPCRPAPCRSSTSMRCFARRRSRLPGKARESGLKKPPIQWTCAPLAGPSPHLPSFPHQTLSSQRARKLKHGRVSESTWQCYGKQHHSQELQHWPSFVWILVI